METHLKKYLQKFKKNDPELLPSFKGWIAHYHPENVTLDDRLYIPNNPHELVWNNLTKESGRGWFSNRFGMGITKKRCKFKRCKSNRCKSKRGRYVRTRKH